MYLDRHILFFGQSLLWLHTPEVILVVAIRYYRNICKFLKCIYLLFDVSYHCRER